MGQRNAIDLLNDDLARTQRVASLSPGVARRSAQSSLTNPADWFLNALGGNPTSSGKRISENLAFNVPAFYAAVDITSKLVAMLPLRLMQKTSSGPAEVNDHSAAWLVKDKPNNFQTPFEFKRYLMACTAARGNGYARVYRDRYYQPTELCPVHPSRIHPEFIEKLRSVIYKGHAVDDPAGYLLSSDVLHNKALSTDGVQGLSPLAVLRESLGLSLTYQEHTGSTFANGGRMPGFITSDTIYTEAQIKDFLAAYKQSYGGAENSGKPRVLNGFKWTSIGMSNEDAELLASRKFELEEVARVFGIPPHLLGHTEKSTSWGSGIEEQNRGVETYVLGPWLVNLEQVLNATLLTEDERRKERLYFKHNVNALLRANPKSRAEFYKIMREISALAPNEIRELEDMPLFEGEWADDPRAPFNGQGGGNASAPAKTPSPDAAEKTAAASA